MKLSLILASGWATAVAGLPQAPNEEPPAADEVSAAVTSSENLVEVVKELDERDDDAAEEKLIALAPKIDELVEDAQQVLDRLNGENDAPGPDQQEQEDTPEFFGNIDEPEGQSVLFFLSAEGDQEYRCDGDKAVFTGPQARLMFNNQLVGFHSFIRNANDKIQPKWSLLDTDVTAEGLQSLKTFVEESELEAFLGEAAGAPRIGDFIGQPKPLAKQPNKDGNVPLLRVDRNTATGLLSKVVGVQRLDTEGGVAPNCSDLSDDQKQNIQGVPYKATYSFLVNDSTDTSTPQPSDDDGSSSPAEELPPVELNSEVDLEANRVEGPGESPSGNIDGQNLDDAENDSNVTEEEEQVISPSGESDAPVASSGSVDVPAGQSLLFTLSAAGDMTYRCNGNDADFVGMAARLSFEGQEVGNHFSNVDGDKVVPTQLRWTLVSGEATNETVDALIAFVNGEGNEALLGDEDGSFRRGDFIGDLGTATPAPTDGTGGALIATKVSGSGLLSNIVAVQRAGMSGGIAPNCNALSDADKTRPQRVEFTANYNFLVDDSQNLEGASNSQETTTGSESEAPASLGKVDVPAGQSVLFELPARGFQTYKCNDQDELVFDGPEAILEFNGEQVGFHDFIRNADGTPKAPRWMLFEAGNTRDGLEGLTAFVEGEGRSDLLGDSLPAPRIGDFIGNTPAAGDLSNGDENVPLLRLEVAQATGILSNIVGVQRLNTVGGVKPDVDCTQLSAEQKRRAQRVFYTATYTFLVNDNGETEDSPDAGDEDAE